MERLFKVEKGEKGGQIPFREGFVKEAREKGNSGLKVRLEGDPRFFHLPEAHFRVDSREKVIIYTQHLTRDWTEKNEAPAEGLQVIKDEEIPPKSYVSFQYCEEGFDFFENSS